MRWISDEAMSRLRTAPLAPDLDHTPYRLIEPIGRGYVDKDP